MDRILLAIIASCVLLLVGAASLYVMNAGDLRQARPLAIIGP